MTHHNYKNSRPKKDDYFYGLGAFGTGSKTLQDIFSSEAKKSTGKVY